jgi:hypothetical protein
VAWPMRRCWGPSHMTATHRCTCGVRAESFRDYFVQFGSVADVVIMYDNTTKRSRGFGFITFDAGRIS